MFGRQPNLPVDIMFGLNQDKDSEAASYDEFVEKLRNNLQSSYRLATDLALKSKAKQKRLYDRGTRDAPLRLGDRVLVQHKHITGMQKLADRWETHPYVVVSKHPDVPVYVVCNQDTGKERTLHRNLLTPCMFLPLDDSISDPNSPSTSKANSPSQIVSEVEPTIKSPKTTDDESPSKNSPDRLPIRPQRVRKPPDRFTYECVGQTKQHRASEKSLQELYESKLKIGKRLWTRWKSPEMAEVRMKVGRRFLFSQIMSN